MCSLDMRMCARGLILIIILMVVTAAPAFAHKVGIFATVNNGVIEGEVYSSGGDALKDCPVTFLGPDGEKLGETRTQDDGTFRFKTTVHAEQLIVVDTDDGHRAEFRISADELGSIEPVIAQTQAGVDAVPDDMDQRIAAAVARAIRPLRKQIDEYEQKTRFRDVLGGFGYIFGLAGVLLYFKACKKHVS